jgi:hypothetical protein
VPVITGAVNAADVKVLFVSVSLPATVAKFWSVKAVLNSAIVPVIVFVPSAIDLLVNVCVLAAESTQASPEVVEELTLRTNPFVEAADKIVTASFALPAIKSPFAAIADVGIYGFAVISVASLSTQITPVVRDVVGAEFVNTEVADVGCPPTVPFESTQINQSGISGGVKSAGAGSVLSTSPPDEGRFSRAVMSS